LQDARLYLRPYSNFDIATAAVAWPTGAKLAGRYGRGMISIGATTAAGFDALGQHWDMVETEAKHHGHVADRSKWRLVGLCHIADTMIRAQKMRPDLAVVHAKAVETAQAIYDSEKAARTAAE
jgi:limonene 1,2-monooxygenase